MAVELVFEDGKKKRKKKVVVSSFEQKRKSLFLSFEATFYYVALAGL